MLAMATFAGDVEMVDMLLESDYFDQWSLDMALIIACCSSRPSLVIAQRLAEAGADIDMEVPDGFEVEYDPETMREEAALLFAPAGLFRHYKACGYSLIHPRDEVMPQEEAARKEKKKIIEWIS